MLNRYQADTVYQWDGAHHLTVLGESWWHLEASTLDDIAHAILYDQTEDRELADRRAKDFSVQVLRPLAGHMAYIPATDVSEWLLASAPQIPRPSLGPAWIACSECGSSILIPVMHLDVVETFGTLCSVCRGGPL